MRPGEKHRPAEYVTPSIGPERVARMWDAIDSAEKKPNRGPWRLAAIAAGGAIALAAAVVVVVREKHVGPTHLEASTATYSKSGDVIVTDHETALALPDGSALTLGAATNLSVASASADDVRLRLDRGSVSCEVPHREGRQFTVEADGTWVHVRGTHFTVSIDDADAGEPTLRVQVQRGLVELTNGSDATPIASLAAGQTWSRVRTATSLAPMQVGTTHPAPSIASSLIASPAAAPPSAALDATALFERANTARLAGRAADAARDYDRLRTRFPGDSRSGLAAFELARIRLDSLHDPRRALEALRFALDHNHGAFVAEDGEALRVDALGKLGDASCPQARDTFLKAHPASPHARRVTRACEGG